MERWFGISLSVYVANRLLLPNKGKTKSAGVRGVSPVGGKVAKLWRKGFVEKVSFEPGMEERRSNGWWQWWYDELTCVRSDESDKSVWYVGRRSSLGNWFQREGDAWRKERLLTFREEEEGGRERVTTSEERMLRRDWTEIRLYRYEGWEVVKILYVRERIFVLNQCNDLRARLIWEDWGPDDGTCEIILDVLKTV